MSTEKRSQIIAEDLGDDAVAALANGTEWSYEPETVEFGDAWAYNCGGDDGCNRLWHKHWIMSGYSIENGVLTHDLHECDEDGNWDRIDGCDVDDPSYDEWYKSNFDEKERQRGWRDYAAYVAKTGKDPLGNYIVQTSHKEAWTVKVIQDNEGVKFYGAHRQSVAFIDRVAEKDVNKLPKDVRQFLSIQYGLVGGYKSLDDLKDGGHSYTLERGDGYAIITFKIDVADDPALIRQRLMEAAEQDATEEEDSD